MGVGGGGGGLWGEGGGCGVRGKRRWREGREDGCEKEEVVLW